MRYYLRLELNRAFRGRYMMIVLLVGCGLSLWHFYDYIWPLRSCVLQGSYPLSSFDRWLGGENYSFQAKIYFMFLPILCALPHSASWLFDGASGFGNQVIIRRGQRDYVRAKYLVTFLSGAAVAVLPLLFDFLITNLVVPAVCPQAGYGLSPINATKLWGDAYFSHPFLYLLVYLLMDGAFYGLFTTLSLTGTIYLKNRYLVQLLPFLAYMALYCLGSTTGYLSMCPAGFLRPSQLFAAKLPWLTGEALALLATSVLFIRRSEKQEMGLL